MTFEPKIRHKVAAVNIADEYIDQAAQQLADDIDFEVLSTVFVESGWTKVVLQPMTWERGAEIDLWVHKNINGGTHDRGLVWLFEDPKEATWFKLRWLS